MTKILLGDDAQLFLEVGRSFLERSGCRVDTASNGRELLERARADPPDLILLDAHLPGIDGFACCRGIRGDPALAGTRVVLVASPMEQASCTEAGADGFVPGPLTRARLLETVRRFVPVPERDSDRVGVALKVAFRSGAVEGRGFSRDLGAGGFFLKTHDLLSPGASVELEFSLPNPGAEPIRGEGRVVRTVEEEAGPHHGPGMAIEFERLSARAKLEISRFVRERAEKEP